MREHGEKNAATCLQRFAYFINRSVLTNRKCRNQNVCVEQEMETIHRIDCATVNHYERLQEPLPHIEKKTAYIFQFWNPIGRWRTVGIREHVNRRTHRVYRGVECICPLSWNVHYNFVRDGRNSKMGVGVHPPPPPTTRLGWFYPHDGMYARKWPLPLCVSTLWERYLQFATFIQ